VDVLEVFRNSRNTRAVAAGEVLFEKGDSGDMMYVVLEGQIDVTVDGELVESLGPGSLLGEMAIVSDMPRSATATAAEDSKVAAVDETWFIYLIRQTPKFGIHVMSIMAARLRRYMEHGHAPPQGAIST
jgi:CRP-like cAMP-binding protein